MIPGRRIVGAADMDGDSITDLISSVPTTAGSVATELLQVYLGSTTRSMTPAGTFVVPSTVNINLATVHAGDFNLDGWRDVLYTSTFTNTNAFCDFNVAMILGLPGGQLHPAGMDTTHSLNNSGVCPLFTVADFDGDGDLDLVGTPRACPFYYFNNRALLGTGCSGSGAATPGLWYSNALIGNSQFATSISGALNNTHAVLVISLGLCTSPLNTCGVYLDLSGPVVFLPGVTDAYGGITYQLPLPNNPLLHGASFHAQAAVFCTLLAAIRLRMPFWPTISRKS